MKTKSPLKKVYNSLLFQRKKKKPLVLLDGKRLFQAAKVLLEAQYPLRHVESLNASLIWDLRDFLLSHLYFRDGKTDAYDSYMNLYKVMYVASGELVYEARCSGL